MLGLHFQDLRQFLAQSFIKQETENLPTLVLVFKSQLVKLTCIPCIQMSEWMTADANVLIVMAVFSEVALLCFSTAESEFLLKLKVKDGS